MNVFLDFDGTIVEHKYPGIGKYNDGAFEVVKKLISAGHNVILNTCRVEISREAFLPAYNYLLNGLGQHLKYTKTKKHPMEWDFNLFHDFGEIHIDDVGFRHPLKDGMIDWAIVDLEFQANGIY